MTITRILAPVDFSTCAENSARYAARLAHELGGKVDLLHVIELPPHVFPEVSLVNHPSSAKPQTLVQVAMSQAHDALGRLAATLADEGLPVGRRLVAGYARQTILDVALEGYDLIVIGTHGRSGLSRLFLGSVAEQVVRRSRCPVLTVGDKPPRDLCQSRDAKKTAAGG